MAIRFEVDGKGRIRYDEVNTFFRHFGHQRNAVPLLDGVNVFRMFHFAICFYVAVKISKNAVMYPMA